MPVGRILILGCGYTGKRVGRRLLDLGYEVIATSRDVSSLGDSCSRAIRVDIAEPETLEQIDGSVMADTLVLYSLPSVGSSDTTRTIVRHLDRARRIVYLSTTGVYGQVRDVDQATPIAPKTAREWMRVDAEGVIMDAFASALILRPAAIYGPNRGIHSAMLAGSYRLCGDGTNYVSRIHVDDLATHCISGLLSDVTGAWPVADECPCTSGEIAAFCAELLGLPLPQSVPRDELSETRRADRRVDGSAIRHELNIGLRFPSYRVGIPACIETEESETAEDSERAF